MGDSGKRTSLRQCGFNGRVKSFITLGLVKDLNAEEKWFFCVFFDKNFPLNWNQQEWRKIQVGATKMCTMPFPRMPFSQQQVKMSLITNDFNYKWLYLPMTLLTNDFNYKWLYLQMTLLTNDFNYKQLYLQMTLITNEFNYKWL